MMMEILPEPTSNKLCEHLSDTYVFTMKMEILLEPTSNKFMVGLKKKKLIGMVMCITGILLSMVRSDMMDVHDLRSVETEFPAVVFNDELSSEKHALVNPQDSMMRLCHKLIACSIAGRSQAPEKVTVTDLFYLRDIDVVSVNIPYPLARYLRRLQGLTVIVRDLLVIDITELVRLQICEELVDTWAWVAPRLERQPDAAAGALVDARGAPDIDEGAQAIPAPTQAPQPPLATGPAQTMAPRLARVEEELLDSAGATYVRYSETHVPYQRCRVRQRTGEASTLAAPLDEDQPDL
uniref:Uncharacterized protein n=1 Tax=Tanacetum cinerariifolium TaxID=118510 RepID=A0A6L2JTK2_TANCI|nr:hypothetical protein [Tanacetum cinerariifolium]